LTFLTLQTKTLCGPELYLSPTSILPLPVILMRKSCALAPAHHLPAMLLTS